MRGGLDLLASTRFDAAAICDASCFRRGGHVLSICAVHVALSLRVRCVHALKQGMRLRRYVLTGRVFGGWGVFMDWVSLAAAQCV